MRGLIEKINDLKEKRYGKAVFFFGFYFVFFIIIILCIVFGSKKITMPEDYKNSSPISYTLLKNKNYHFNYKISLDGNDYVYSGDKNGDTETFEFNSKKYFRNSSDYYVLDNTWQKCDDPYKVNYLLEPTNIEGIIGLASYDSATQYSTGKGVYVLLLSSNTLVKTVYNKDTDIEEVPNKINVSIDVNKEIEKIEMNLDSYCKVSDDCNNTLRVTLEYTQRGEIASIQNPINS